MYFLPGYAYTTTQHETYIERTERLSKLKDRDKYITVIRTVPAYTKTHYYGTLNSDIELQDLILLFDTCPFGGSVKLDGTNFCVTINTD